jgi:hypothetical protein
MNIPRIKMKAVLCKGGLAPMIYRTRNRRLLEFMRAAHLSEVAIKGAQWKVARLPSQLQKQAVRKSNARVPAELVEGRSHRFGILQSEVLMVKQDLDGRGNLPGVTSVDFSQNPHCLRQRQAGNPRAFLHPGLGRRHLPGIILCEESY